MPAFNLELLPVISRGVMLAGYDDALPLDALRHGTNVRTDRIAGVVTPRPGDNAMTAAIDATHLNGLWLSRLFGVSTDYSYAQVGNGAGESVLYRLATLWGAATSLLTIASETPITDANMVDGSHVPWKYMAGPTLRKDNGTTLSLIGIAPPAQPPGGAVLGTRERLPILSFDAGSGSWSNTGVTLLSEEASIKVEGSNSLQVDVAANTLAVIWRGFETTFAHVSGTDDSGVSNKTTSLTDTTKNFVTLGVKYGARLRNTTDGSEAVINRISTTTNANDTLHFTALSGGAQNDVDTGDAYEIYFNLKSFHLAIASGTDNSGVANKTDRTVDTTQNFIEQGVVPGMLLYNTSNGTRGVITAIGTTTNANDTLYVTQGFGGATENDFDNGDTFQVINDLVIDDDYIHVWVRADNVDRVEYLQIDFDVDTQTAASAFQSNYYTRHISGAELNQGNDVWTELKLPKSSFTLIGTAEEWDNVRAVRFSMKTSTEGAVTFYFDDLSLIGGYGIEGDIEYTAVYRNSATGARGSPPKVAAFDGTETVLYTIAVKAERHPITIDLSNIDAPSDTQINQICLYRRGGVLTQARLVARLSDATTTYTDKKSDLELIGAELLETDNDRPPSTTTAVFGGVNRVFYIANQNEIYPSKPWEDEENRAENVPNQGAFHAGDGSAIVVNGIFEGSTGFVFTEEGTYAILGLSQDTFMTQRLVGSRGLASRTGLTSGDGRIFFVATDGIYAQHGQQQVKQTAGIEPFFQGRTVHGQAPLAVTLLSQSSLVWHPDPVTPFLVFTYRESGGANPYRQLVLKRNPQTGQYTEAFFDHRTDYQIRQTYSDPTLRRLFGLGNDAKVYELEDETQLSDEGTDIAFAFQTVASGQPNPMRDKQYESIAIEANSASETLTVTALYDRGATTAAVGTMQTAADTATGLLQTDSTTRRHDLAVKVEGSVNTLVKVFRVGWHTLVEPEPLTFHDTGEIPMDELQTVQRLLVEIDAPAAVTVTVYLDGTAQDALTLSATTGHDEVVLMTPAFGYEGRMVRVTLASATPFYLYKVVVHTVLIRPEAVTWWDSDTISLELTQSLQRFSVDIDAPSDVTAIVYVDGIPEAAQTLEATSGRQTVVLLQAEGLEGKNVRVTLASASRFRLYGLILYTVLITPEAQTWFDSDTISLEATQTLQRLSVDIDAPVAVTATVYVDGVAVETQTISATSGRQTVTVLLPEGLEGKNVRVRLTSATAFRLYGLILYTVLIRPEPMEWYDSDTLTFEHVHTCQRLSFDIDAPGDVTVTLYRDGVPQAARILFATAGRQRLPFLLPAGQKARAFRLVCRSDTAFRLYHLGLVVKPLGMPEHAAERVLVEIPASAQPGQMPIYQAQASTQPNQVRLHKAQASAQEASRVIYGVAA